MSDIVTTYQCSTLQYFESIVIGSKGDKYLVLCVDGKWTCTCPGFHYTGKCKHEKAEQAKACTWRQQISGGKKPKKKKGKMFCPECGAEAVDVRGDV